MRALSSLAFALLVSFALDASIAAAQYPHPDRWILQASSRQVTGFGFTRGDIKDQFILESGIRTDFLWGRPGDEHVRLGPAIDFRSADYDTVELGVGGTLLLPVFRAYPITLTAVGGYAWRRQVMGGDGGYVSGTFAWGYRPYNYFSRYGFGIMAFGSVRVHLDNPADWEMTFGVEFDMELALVVPILMVRMAATGDDPDEPVDENDPFVEDVGGASTQPAPSEPPPVETLPPPAP